MSPGSSVDRMEEPPTAEEAQRRFNEQFAEHQNALMRLIAQRQAEEAAASPPVDTKDSNPKEAMGEKKLPFVLVPDTLVIYATLGFLEGALKYGQYNWAAAGVRFSTYLSAIERHYRSVKGGEWEDPVTKVPHLASIIACCGIILDANIRNKILDDRPPPTRTANLIREMEGSVAHLKDLFKDYHPHQHTIQDYLEKK